MGRIADFFRSVTGRAVVRSEADAERLRIAFKARYHSFRLLLEANQRALEIMAELDQTRRGARPFGMTYVRARCTRVATQVWQMVRHLDDLAPARYRGLFDRFDEIRAAIEPFLARPGHEAEGSLVLPLDEINADNVDQVGGKMANLGEMLNRIGLRVPEGFAVTAHGFRRFMRNGNLQEEINRRLQVAGGEDPDRLPAISDEIRGLILRAPIPPELERAILDSHRDLQRARGDDVRVAVRSSALDEDTAGASVAGQYHSELNVGAHGVLDAYRLVLASVYDLSAISHRVTHGLRHEDVVMCVGVLPMVDARSGGVAYSRNPLDSADLSVILNSAWGLPMPVVEGRIPSDLFVVAREEPFEILHREIRTKTTRFDCSRGDGACRMSTTEDERSEPSLDEAQIRDLARLALRLETHYGVPQDVEWAVDRDGAIHLLQSRPLRLQQRTRIRSPGASTRGDPARPAGDVLLSDGITASSGAATGRVFVVATQADAARFPAGGVLVTVQPLPSWASLMSRAAAIVAENGSMAGHLANVAREYGIPALFSVEDAVRRLSAETEITVDADSRLVYRGRIESLLVQAEPAPNPMRDSPVYEALNGAMKHIAPLHLLNPDDPGFRPEACRTLHDITRFSHEKAVQEMFRFGKDHHFPQRSSKQLYAEVPMQWWVLNLDDGFREEVEGRYVRLDNIASRPMIALWDGITAIPWEGPPPLDGRGFMSVLFGATTNTALNPTVRSRYVDRNYFMVSRHYCSLSSRLGAHFSIVEAMVSDRTSENYVSFQFKGGAADFDRRLRRVVFVREILEELGFRTSTNEDNLIARLEGHGASYVLGRLRVLGYLTIHTRQLDMVMARPAAVDHYRKKITSEIDRILNPDRKAGEQP